MINLFIPRERQEEVLKAAGYWKHATQGKDGLTVYGYILEMPPRIRWHAVMGEEWLNIHQDWTTRNGYHIVYVRDGVEKREKSRLMQIYREIYAQENEGEIMKVSKKGEFAPNLRELQKNHKTAIQSQENDSVESNQELSTGTH